MAARCYSSLVGGSLFPSVLMSVPAGASQTLLLLQIEWDTWDAESEYCSTDVRRNFAFQLCMACKEANWTRRRSLLLCCVRAVHNGREASQVQVRRVRRRLRGKQYWLDAEWLGFACCLSGNFQYRPAIARLILSFVCSAVQCALRLVHSQQGAALSAERLPAGQASWSPMKSSNEPVVVR